RRRDQPPMYRSYASAATSKLMARHCQAPGSWPSGEPVRDDSVDMEERDRVGESGGGLLSGERPAPVVPVDLVGVELEWLGMVGVAEAGADRVVGAVERLRVEELAHRAQPAVPADVRHPRSAVEGEGRLVLVEEEPLRVLREQGEQGALEVEPRRERVRR